MDGYSRQQNRGRRVPTGSIPEDMVVGQEIWVLDIEQSDNRPHGLNEVTSISFSPFLAKEKILLVTTGEDKQVKAWRLRTNVDRKGEVEGTTFFLIIFPWAQPELADFWVPRSSFHYRSELPSQAAWSNDASLIAVAAGSFVPIYDSSTNALLQVLVAPECGRVTSVHFLGSSGRFLAAAGERDLVLWDLVSQTSVCSLSSTSIFYSCDREVQWHFRSGIPIGQVVAHPSEDKLALLQPRKNTNSGQQETRVLLLRPSSAIPFRTCLIPFGIRNATWYSLVEGTTVDFNLVGVTDSWGVVLFGDDVKSPSSLEGTTSTQIMSNAHLFKKNTLLQDIFGKSAFDDVTHPTVSAETSAFIPREGKQAITSFFDAPAYLMSPLETMFDSIMQTFLTPRSTVKSGEDGAKQVEKDDEEMDVDEDPVPEDDSPLIVKNTTRVVDEREMDEFVKIFKQYGVTGMYHL
jgi:NET1-associated nuclear protein 1 (U3 small nucleolar RNA-associated protein 17)